MLTRLTITFTNEEREALASLAEKEVRPVKHEIRFIVRQELVRRGLLSWGLDTQEGQHQQSLPFAGGAEGNVP